MDVGVVGFLLLGAFYTFAGFAGVEMACRSRLFDIAIAKISMKRPPQAETLKGLWFIGQGLVILAGGLALLLRLDLAAVFFLIGAAGQALYLGLLGPFYFDKSDPPDPRGRAQSQNAFVIYLAATAIVVWGTWTGRLLSIDRVSWWAHGAALAVLAGYGAFAAKRFAWPLADRGASTGSE